jgi:hypothetical protein
MSSTAQPQKVKMHLGDKIVEVYPMSEQANLDHYTRQFPQGERAFHEDADREAMAYADHRETQVSRRYDHA